MSGIENLFAPKTIAFGGVATGSIKAQLAARTTGIVKKQVAHQLIQQLHQQPVKTYSLLQH